VVAALVKDAPNWLLRLNNYRRLARVAPVTEDTALSDAEVSHAHYLVVNYSADFTVGRNLGGAMHTEDPSKEWYSPGGLSAAKQSDLLEGCDQLTAQDHALDWWMAAPFHRLSLLNPQMGSAAYGSYQKPEGCWVAGLRLVPSMQAHETRTEFPVEFPGDGSEVSLTTISPNEWPNLLPSCSGYTSQAGFPITIQFGLGAAPVVQQSTIARNGQPVEHCMVQANNYENPILADKAWGRNVLSLFGAVVLIPRQPLLADSHYTVHILADGHSYDWQFTTR
jgi:hypothetical protein